METRLGSGAMFDRIAPKYDVMNRMMSLGLDQRWRRKLIAMLELKPGDRVLDVATGTADVALAIAQTIPQSMVVGVDPSNAMLAVGRQKIIASQLQQRIELLGGSAEALPFVDQQFSGTCISFGIRNVPDRDLGLREMIRVTKSGGRVAVLELGEPSTGPFGFFARLYVHRVVPLLGRIFAGRSTEYTYLKDSVAKFPAPEVFAASMVRAGLRDVKFSRLSFGAAHLYVGIVK